MQRIAQYPLLLAQLSKYTEAENEDAADLKHALEIMSNIAASINETKRLVHTEWRLEIDSKWNHYNLNFEMQLYAGCMEIKKLILFKFGRFALWFLSPLVNFSIPPPLPIKVNRKWRVCKIYSMFTSRFVLAGKGFYTQCPSYGLLKYRDIFSL